MALSDDQRAMLRLLAQREEGYDDIAALMGLSVEEVRAKVKEALGAVDDSDSSPKPDAPPPQPSSPEPPRQQPKSSEPESPAKPSTSKKTPKPKGTSRSRPAFRGDRPGLKLPTGRGGRLAILAGAAVVVLMVVLLLVTGGSGDESSNSSDASSTTTAANGSDLLRDKRITGAVLTAPGGGDASGLAVLGRNGKEPLLQLEAEGLEPSPEGETYTIWLYKSPKLVLRAGAVKEVGDNGLLVTQLPIPLEVLQYIAAGAFDQIDVSLTPDAAYEAELAAAKKAKRLPRYIGTSVLRGEIVGPLVNAGKGQGG